MREGSKKVIDSHKKSFEVKQYLVKANSLCMYLYIHLSIHISSYYRGTSFYLLQLILASIQEELSPLQPRTSSHNCAVSSGNLYIAFSLFLSFYVCIYPFIHMFLPT